MRLKHHLPLSPSALGATAAMIAAMIAMTFGVGVSLAADYQDEKANVCEGTFSAGACAWGSHPVTGFENVALGDGMMPSLTGGSGNVALNHGALASNTTGKSNLALGPGALGSNSEGSFNVASGLNAMFFNTTGSNNVASGHDALLNNTTASNNIASGFKALFSNTTGESNIASGAEALKANTTGSENVANGAVALVTNKTGSNNIATGGGALFSNTSGNHNIASGFHTLFSNTEGGGNIASGFEALRTNTTGISNLALGNEALRLTTGSFNVALGNSAGLKLTTGSNNIDIANEGVAGEAGKIRIGTTGKQTAAFLAGVYKAASPGPLLAVKVDPNGQLVTAKSSSARFKEEVRGLGASTGRVLSLRPVSYRYKPAYAHGSDQLQYGLIAEQVARLFPSLVQYEANGKPGGVYYEELPVLLLAQLQHEHTALRDTRAQVSHQQHQIDQLASELQALRAEIHTRR